MISRSRFLSQMVLRQRFSICDGFIASSFKVNIASNNRVEFRNQSMITKSVDESYLKKFMDAVGWMDQNRTRLKLNGYLLYENMHSHILYEDWFEKLDLPDTFASWFTVTELHIWLLMLRYMQEDAIITSDGKVKYGKGDGYFVRNCLVEAMWADVGNRIKLLQGANPAVARKQVAEMSEQFQAALIAYDEGLSDDRIMAAAIWRRFYALSNDVNFENIEKILHFVRHQITELMKLSSEDLRTKSNISWLNIKKY